MRPGRTIDKEELEFAIEQNIWVSFFKKVQLYLHNYDRENIDIIILENFQLGVLDGI